MEEPHRRRKYDSIPISKKNNFCAHSDFQRDMSPPWKCKQLEKYKEEN